MKNKIIAGNWKMNKTVAETKLFFEDLISRVKNTSNTVVLCVPYTDLATAVEMTKNTSVSIGAQNVHWAESGAFTGEISAEMLTELGVKYVVIGHSERRQFFGETNQTVQSRAQAALKHGLKPIVCVGETLEQRQSNQTHAVLKSQIEEGLGQLSASQMSDTIVAYEPIWAIGTGVTASNDEANEAIGYIRSVVEGKFGMETARNLYIQYGGSMNEKNARDLLSMSEIDGGLVGGASLSAEKFEIIVKAK